MRKYDIKNKRNIGIILAISVGIIIMFSLCIKIFLSTDREEYQVSSNTIVFDKDKEIIKLSDSGIIKTKWNKEYYLTYQKEDYELGNTALAYNEEKGEIYLYGRYYEIGSSEEINITENETVIKSTALTKFYKLADRKYLVIDKEIKSSDGLLTTTDFLMVDLDKVGNATLTNHKVSLKTFSETTIVTSNYTFDIANEILTYGSDKIDLKKIIGSSNTYTKEDLIPEENNDGEQGGGGTGSDTSIIEENNNPGSNGNNTVTIEEVKKETKRTSIISVTSSVSKITVDYVIYDPKNEYTSVYMEVNRAGASDIERVRLNSNSTVYELSNLIPNTSYDLTFKYSYLDEENNEQTETFDSVTITTKSPSISLKVTRTSPGKIHYLITTDNSYPINSATLLVLINNTEVQRSEISIDGNTTSSIDVPNIEGNDTVELRLVDFKSNGNVINGLTASTKFKY